MTINPLIFEGFFFCKTGRFRHRKMFAKVINVPNLHIGRRTIPTVLQWKPKAEKRINRYSADDCCIEKALRKKFFLDAFFISEKKEKTK